MAATPTAPTRERFDKAMLPPNQAWRQQANQNANQQAQPDTERPTYNPPGPSRHRYKNHAQSSNDTPSWFHRLFSMFQGTIRPEQQRFFSASFKSFQTGSRHGYFEKAVMKRRRIRDIAHESRKVNRGRS